MKIEIKRTKGLMFHSTLSSNDMEIMDQCIHLSDAVWYGFVDNKLACIWGVIPPTLMSSTAYLWLYTTELVKEHQFAFVRHSQRAIEVILNEYNTIVGYCLIDAEQSKRWLKWLGAEFGHPEGRKLPFVIRKK